MNKNGLKFIRRSNEIAQHARDKGNHPFGALLVDEQDNILFNLSEESPYYDNVTLNRCSTKSSFLTNLRTAYVVMSSEI